MSSGADYWEVQGRIAAESELDAVCYPGAPSSLNRYASWSQRRAFEALLRRVGSLGGTPVLDVGCGTGRWSRLLAGRGAEVVGIDRSSAMLEQARHRSPDSIEFRRMSATELDYPAGTFAFACAVTVVQHLPYPDQLRAIAELVRVVRSGGHVLTVDRTGAGSAFSTVYGTYPRSRGEWQAAWEAADGELVDARPQELSWPLVPLRRLSERRKSGGDAMPRRGGRGWRRQALNALVVACYPLELLGGVWPGAPSEHVAALYRIH